MFIEDVPAQIFKNKAQATWGGVRRTRASRQGADCGQADRWADIRENRDESW